MVNPKKTSVIAVKNAVGFLITESALDNITSGVIALDKGAVTVMLDAEADEITVMYRDMTTTAFQLLIQSITDKLNAVGFIMTDIKLINGTSISSCQGIKIKYA
ncbi:MAG: hypothetical protein PHT13_00010 [Methanosarcina sp.]|nr:hypothetical protein [Methanosarcina sp.]